METIKTKSCVISILFAFAIIFHSCMAYNPQHVSVEDAASEGKRAKIKMKIGKRLKYKKIVKDNSLYFGMAKSKGKWVKIHIDTSKVESVRLQNKTMSTILTISGVLLTVGIIGLTFIFATTDFSEIGRLSTPSPGS